MVKNCKILTNNDAITVVEYGNIQVQIPSIHREAETVKVLYKDGSYTVVDDNYVESKNDVKETSTKTLKKTSNEKTTTKEKSDDTDEVNKNS